MKRYGFAVFLLCMVLSACVMTGADVEHEQEAFTKSNIQELMHVAGGGSARINH